MLEILCCIFFLLAQLAFMAACRGNVFESLSPHMSRINAFQSPARVFLDKYRGVLLLHCLLLTALAVFSKEQGITVVGKAISGTAS